MREKHDTVIIGGGQAGLAMSYCLRQRGREHIVLERQRVAERWRTERWDSLRFQLPNSWLELPGKSYAGSDPDGFVHHSAELRRHLMGLRSHDCPSSNFISCAWWLTI
jgi:putative flavoprotein involved in K+ transport